MRHCVDSANCWAKFIWHLGANHERNPSKHIVRQSSAIKGIDWLDKNILLSLSLNWDEAFFQETVPLWSTYGLHRITVENALSVQLRLLIYKTTNVPLYIYILALKYSYHSFWFCLDWIYMVVASAAEPHILDLVFLCCDDVEKRWSNHRQSSDWEENKWVFFSFLTSTKERQHFASLFVLNWLTWQMVSDTDTETMCLV